MPLSIFINLGLLLPSFLFICQVLTSLTGFYSMNSPQ